MVKSKALGFLVFSLSLCVFAESTDVDLMDGRKTGLAQEMELIRDMQQAGVSKDELGHLLSQLENKVGGSAEKEVDEEFEASESASGSVSESASTAETASGDSRSASESASGSNRESASTTDAASGDSRSASESTSGSVSVSASSTEASSGDSRSASESTSGSVSASASSTEASSGSISGSASGSDSGSARTHKSSGSGDKGSAGAGKVDEFTPADGSTAGDEKGLQYQDRATVAKKNSINATSSSNGVSRSSSGSSGHHSSESASGVSSGSGTASSHGSSGPAASSSGESSGSSSSRSSATGSASTAESASSESSGSSSIRSSATGSASTADSASTSASTTDSTTDSASTSASASASTSASTSASASASASASSSTQTGSAKKDVKNMLLGSIMLDGIASASDVTLTMQQALKDVITERILGTPKVTVELVLGVLGGKSTTSRRRLLSVLKIGYKIYASNSAQMQEAKLSMSSLGKDPTSASVFLEDLKKKDTGFAVVRDLSVVDGAGVTGKPAVSLDDGGLSEAVAKNARDTEMAKNDSKKQKMENCRKAVTKEECDRYCMACGDW